jgi:hypothetical protein
VKLFLIYFSSFWVYFLNFLSFAAPLSEGTQRVACRRKEQPTLFSLCGGRGGTKAKQRFQFFSIPSQTTHARTRARTPDSTPAQHAQLRIGQHY